MNRLIFFCTLITTLCGCYSQSRVYYVSSRFTAEEAIQIEEAAAEWRTKTGGDIWLVFGSKYNDDVDMVVPVESATYCSHHDEGPSYTIYINRQCQNLKTPITVRYSAMHEFGHALGINKGGTDGHGHLPAGYGIMSRDPNFGWKEEVTCADARAYCTFNDCNPRELPACQPNPLSTSN